MYVDAVHDRETDKILVAERDRGKRILREYDPRYIAYFPSNKGKYMSICGTQLDKIEYNNQKTFKKELINLSGRKLFEHDINPVFRCIEDHYLGLPAPKLHVCFFDIEVDFDFDRGFSSPEDPFNEVTAITVYLDWLDALITLAVPPKRDNKKGYLGLSVDEAREMVSDLDGAENIFIFDSEEELLKQFLLLIEDADILTGWNSGSYDIPYLVNRTTLVLSKSHTKQFCLWDKFPRKRVFTKFRKEHTTYDLIGRVHLDYLDLYRKNSPKEVHSYRLDFIGEIEVGDNKVPYEGTLDQLYNEDFKKFIEYNRQDTYLMVKIDRKNKFIDLANNMSHESGVLIDNALGTVALVEQAIVLEAHSQGLIVPSKKNDGFGPRAVADEDDDEEEDGSDAVAGAYVVTPKSGLHEWVGSVDINSLYPSTIRTFNMGPETLVAQIRQDLTDAFLKDKISKGMTGAGAWGMLFSCLEYEEVINKTRTKLWLDFEDGKSMQLEAHEIYSLVFESGQPWCISANGTIFRTDKQAIVPRFLERNYAERKMMQAKAREYLKALDGIEISDELAEKLKQ